jgi:hypothetical protein
VIVGDGSGAQDSCCCCDGENPSLVVDDTALLLDMLDNMLAFEFWKADVVVGDDADGSAGYGGRLEDALDRSMADGYARLKMWYRRDI